VGSGEIIYIFGYLSLIQQESASTSVDAADYAQTTIPVKVSGYTRSWGAVRENENADFKRYVKFPSGDLVDRFCWATLIENADGFVNGVCIEVDASELRNLDYRETGYDRVEITQSVTAYNGFRLKNYSVYTYIAKNYCENIDLSSTFIDSNYINLGISGAADLDKKVNGFLSDYINSTSIPMASICSLRQVFWGETGSNLYLLDPDSSNFLIHSFTTRVFKKTESLPIDSFFDQSVTDKYKHIDDRTSLCPNAEPVNHEDIYYRSKNSCLKEALSLVLNIDDFILKICLLKNPNIEKEIKIKLINNGNWIVKMVALDLGFEVVCDDEWFFRLC
jgi:hypothetical protein